MAIAGYVEPGGLSVEDGLTPETARTAAMAEAVAKMTMTACKTQTPAC